MVLRCVPPQWVARERPAFLKGMPALPGLEAIFISPSCTSRAFVHQSRTLRRPLPVLPVAGAPSNSLAFVGGVL